MVSVFVELGLIRFLLQHLMGIVLIMEKIQPHLIEQQVKRQEAGQYNMVVALSHGFCKYNAVWNGSYRPAIPVLRLSSHTFWGIPVSGTTLDNVTQLLS